MIKLQHYSQINLQGRSFSVLFSDKKFLKPRVLQTEDSLEVYKSETSNVAHRTILEAWIKDYAKKHLIARTYELAKQFDFNPKKVAIKDQSTRWGSCSSKGNINLNWRLIFTPQTIIDYVIIHELCHLKQMNHSQNFWNLVATIMPEYKKSRMWLKENGKYLKIE